VSVGQAPLAGTTGLPPFTMAAWNWLDIWQDDPVAYEAYQTSRAYTDVVGQCILALSTRCVHSLSLLSTLLTARLHSFRSFLLRSVRCEGMASLSEGPVGWRGSARIRHDAPLACGDRWIRRARHAALRRLRTSRTRRRTAPPSVPVPCDEQSR
jgi:hypothetical protein